jgi:hypothetical protein
LLLCFPLCFPIGSTALKRSQAMRQVTIRDAVRGWSGEDLSNLWSLLDGGADTATVEMIEARVKWLYHSRAGAGTEAALRNVFNEC